MPPALTVVLSSRASRHGTGGRIAAWLAEQWPGPVHVDDVGGPSRTGAVVVVVPAYARPAELARLVAPLRGARVAVLAYGGVDRGAAITSDVHAALAEADVEVIPFGMALNAALVRVGRFSAFDVISAGIVLDALQPCHAACEPDGRS